MDLIVVDTNVLVSGIFWRGPPSRVLDLWARDRIGLAASPSILAEYRRVLEKIGRERGAPALAHQWIRFIARHATVVDAPAVFHGARDPDDDKFVDCALAAGAKIIVSGDKDLLEAKIPQWVQVFSPRRFVAAHLNPR